MNGYILLLVVVLAGLVVVGFFAWSYLRPVPQVVRPHNLERLAPEVVALIELVEHSELRVVGNVLGADPAELAIGQAVEVAFEEIAPDVVLPQWRLA